MLSCNLTNWEISKKTVKGESTVCSHRIVCFIIFHFPWAILFVIFSEFWTLFIQVNTSFFLLSQAGGFQALFSESFQPYFIHVASWSWSSRRTDPWDFGVFCVRTVALTLALKCPRLSPFFLLPRYSLKIQSSPNLALLLIYVIREALF